MAEPNIFLPQTAFLEHDYGRVQLKKIVVFTNKTWGGGSGQLLIILWFFNRGPANF